MTSLFFYSHDGRMPCPQCGTLAPHTHEFDEADIRKLVQAGHRVDRFTASPFAVQVLAERQRQQDEEGFTIAGDVAAYPRGELIKAAICFAFFAAYGSAGLKMPVEVAALVKAFWPWDFTWWKSMTQTRALVKATALMIAEGDRRMAAADQAAAEIEAELPEHMR